MKLLLILGVWCLAVTASIENKDNSKIPFKSNEKNNNDWSRTPVDFYLYTRRNRIIGQKITPTDESIKASNFDSAHPTRIIIPGYYTNCSTPVIIQITSAWLKSRQCNVIVVNWPIAFDRLYSNSALAVPSVGKKIALFINHLVQNHRMLLETTHVIGYGLGAHVAGFTGKNIKIGQINTIIGLNPTSASFSYNEPSKRLNSTDAYYVETIQTSVDWMGYKNPIGKASFYPKGGVYQPSCEDILCDHKRSAEYYAESITRNNFVAIKCKSYEDAIADNCGLIHSSVRMGGDKNTFMVSGVFYVPINANSPFGALI